MTAGGGAAGSAAEVSPAACGLRAKQKGQALVEFSLAGFILCILTLSVLEMGRMVLVYATVANAARAGARYAVVHGSSRSTGAGASNASGPSANPSQVLTQVKNFASAGLLTTSRLVITVTYPGASNAPGQLVDVTVSYPYDPLTTWLPLRVNLGSTTQGVIAF
jgi:Flp pilus assembly protein TadG